MIRARWSGRSRFVKSAFVGQGLWARFRLALQEQRAEAGSGTASGAGVPGVEFLAGLNEQVGADPIAHALGAVEVGSG